MRKRRNQQEMETIKDAIYNFAHEMRPVSVRQIFYNLTTQVGYSRQNRKCL